MPAALCRHGRAVADVREAQAMSEQSLSRRAWTPREVAAQLGIPYETVLDLIHKGKIKALKAGRYYLVPDFELGRYLHSCQ
jgi:excisionase family DNA binding protein